MSTARCAACGSSQPAGSTICKTCGTAMPVATTLDDVPPVAAGPDVARGTVPNAPLSAAVQPQHLAPPARPAQSAQNRGAAANVPAGTIIDGKYAVVRLLGQGGMGVVYLARDIHTGIDVVLKAVRSELAHRADVRARTLDEGRVLGQIDHPNVVHLKAVVVDDKSLWLVMQYIEGESLERTIERYTEQKAHMPLAEALRLFRQITSGIAAAHGEGIIHRDLKPANVLIRKKDHVAKVTDFGIAKTEHDTTVGRVQTKGVIGSIWYMSPEQVTGRRDLDKRVDIYALGIVLFQMLAGRVPFDADSDYEVMRAHADSPMPLVRSLRDDLPASIDALLQKLCAKKRDDRFATCDEVLRAVDTIEAELAGKGTGAEATAGVASSRPEEATKPERKYDVGARPKKDDTAPPVASTRPGPPKAAEAATDEAKPAPRHVGRWIAMGLGLAAVGSVVTLVLTGVLPSPEKWLGPATTRGAASGAPSASSASGNPTAAATATGLAPPSAVPAPTATTPPFERLIGTWVGGGDRLLQAVKVADSIEFRVKDPAQFAPEDYEAGEARFVLRPIAGETSVFNVEDRLRPKPPTAFPFDRDRARASCQDVRTEASGSPLRATFDGARLSVELMKIEPTGANFLFDRDRTISCIGLGKLPASKVVSVLSKADAK